MEDEITIDGVKYRKVEEKKFPIVFNPYWEELKINVFRGGQIEIQDRETKKVVIGFNISGSLGALYKAVEKSKEIRGVK